MVSPFVKSGVLFKLCVNCALYWEDEGQNKDCLTPVDFKYWIQKSIFYLEAHTGRQPLNYAVTAMHPHPYIDVYNFDCRLIFHWKEGGHSLLNVFSVLLLLSQVGCTWINKPNWLCLVCSNITPSWRKLRITKTVGLAWQFRIQQWPLNALFVTLFATHDTNMEDYAKQVTLVFVIF